MGGLCNEDGVVESFYQAVQCSTFNVSANGEKMRRDIPSQCRFRLGVCDDGVLDGLETPDAGRHRRPRTTARENNAARHVSLLR